MHGESEGRCVQPWKLLFKNQAWYLYGWCNQKREERYFKLSRMRNLALLAKPVTHFYKDQPPLEQLQQDAPPFKLLDIVLEVSAQALPALLDEFKVDSVADAPGGKKRITLKMPDIPWFEYTLLGYADEVTVLEPPDLRARLKTRIARMCQNYSN